MDPYDNLFQFDKTTYSIHKYTLIVTLNIIPSTEGTHYVEQSNTIIQESPQLKTHLLRVVASNFDFLDQVLTNT
jgi:hypothetical protein